jgi:hypothetical protein
LEGAEFKPFSGLGAPSLSAKTGKVRLFTSVFAQRLDVEQDRVDFVIL